MNNLLSLIICSRKADVSQELKDNVAATIGCEYELCVIDNSRNEYNIFSAYNEGVRRAKGGILCFMHEDVLFRANGWGCSRFFWGALFAEKTMLLDRTKNGVCELYTR